MVSANQINGVEKMTDRPDVKVTNSTVENAVKRNWNNLGNQIADVENGKVIPR